jgi:pimeloyl-ACP methyl ester carboxylesterase
MFFNIRLCFRHQHVLGCSLLTLIGFLFVSSPSLGQNGRIVRGQIDSESLKANLYGDGSIRPYMVYLPPSYDRTTKRYPVIYALHGYGDDETTLTTVRPGVPSAIPPVLDSMIAGRQLGEVMVVFVCATNRLRGSFYLNSPVIGDYESYITTDLVKQIDGSFRTLATRESRAIVGFSMGGWGAAHLALKFPNVFSVLVSEAGFYDSQSAWFDGLSRQLAAARPSTLAQFDALNFPNDAAQALFAGLLPNTQRPPLFTDYLYEIVAGQLTTNTTAIREASERDVQNGDLPRYAAQPLRLAAIKIVHGTQDPVTPIGGALSFSNALAIAGFPSAYEQHSGAHVFRADLALPFLVTNLMGAQIYVEPAPADLNVPADFPTIQAAVNAARTNDTIHIAPGIYTEQVQIISNKLTLIGQPGTILRATTNMVSFAGSVNSPIMEIRSSEVTVRGLTFEGERLAQRFVGPGDLLGVYLRSSSGTVENCAFYGFRESTPGPENAFAITAAAIHDGEVNVRVAGCTFADNYGAIFCWGLPDRKYINVTIENNIIIGPGPLMGDNNYAGVNIQEGVGGRIADNTISGYSYVGTAADFPISFGILAAGQANPPAFGILQRVIIEGNTLRDNQQHIALIKGDNSEIRNNRLQGTAPGILPLGLVASGTNVTIANNQFEDIPEGIRLLGNDPDFGTILGSAINAQVTSNRFCNVTTNVNVQSLATATQAGTLLCPFPSPALAIAPAALVSWPGTDNGWAIESAPSADGPWTPSDATPFMQHGRHNIAVPTDAARRFFRLR